MSDDDDGEGVTGKREHGESVGDLERGVTGVENWATSHAIDRHWHQKAQHHGLVIWA